MIFPILVYVQIVVSREGFLEEMKGNYIAETVTQVGNKSFPFFLPTSRIKSMTKKYGGLIVGILWITDKTMILVNRFFSNLMN
jgi:hypothetical protein